MMGQQYRSIFTRLYIRISTSKVLWQKKIYFVPAYSLLDLCVFNANGIQLRSISSEQDDSRHRGSWFPRQRYPLFFWHSRSELDRLHYLRIVMLWIRKKILWFNQSFGINFLSDYIWFITAFEFNLHVM